MLNFKLENFTGSLDLLIELVKNKRLNLNDLNIQELTSQYLQIVLQSIGNCDLDNISEYLIMATYLMKLKAQLLLPQPEILEKTQEELDLARDKLAKRLIEYVHYKNVIPSIKQLMIDRSYMFDKAFSDPTIYNPGKEEAQLPTSLNPEIFGNIIEDLIEDIIVENNNFVEISNVEVDSESVEFDIIQYIKTTKINKKSLLHFLKSVNPIKVTRQYFAVAFVVILDLNFRRQISLYQLIAFGDLFFELAPEANFIK